MRILHLVDRLTDRGGAYWHLFGVIEALAREHQVHLLAGRDEGTAPAACPVTVVPGLEARTRQVVGLDEVVARFAPHVIHLHTVVNPAVLEWAGSQPALLTVQDHRYFCPTRGKWTTDGRVCREPMSPGLCAGCFEDDAYFREVYSLTAQRLEAARRLRLVVLSRYMKEELLALGAPEEKVTVVPPFVHGLDPEARADGPPCILFAGRLTEAKGVLDAVEAWREARLGLPLLLAGTGPLRAALAETGAEVLGWVSRARLSCLYRRARAVLMPSRWQEPFGIVGLEALTMGTPVVAWDSGGIREWHPGDGLVPWGDVKALSAALRPAIGRRAEPPPGFQRDLLMDRLLSVYEEVAAG